MRKILGALACATVFAFGSASAVTQNDASFSALDGINAVAMSDGEMQSTTGEVNAYDLLRPLLDRAQTKQGYEALIRLAETMNQAFARVGLLETLPDTDRRVTARTMCCRCSWRRR